ncbi:Nucleoside-triphosphatase, THEP1 type, partial [Cynara cardunculus var. scolymus]
EHLSFLSHFFYLSSTKHEGINTGCYNFINIDTPCNIRGRLLNTYSVKVGEIDSLAMAAPAECFLVSGSPLKLNLVFTPQGVGKTTLIARVLETLRISNPNLKIQGFFTRNALSLYQFNHTIRGNLEYAGEIRQGGERVGFEVVTLDGRTAPLASIHSSSAESIRWPTVGRYKVDVGSFESLALPELQIKEDTDLFVIDEVGKMELFSSLFFPTVLRVLESNKPFLATIPIPKAGLDIPAVVRLKNHPGATVFTLTTSNRDAMKDRIYTELTDKLV